jgi:hypothetical protein
MSEEASTLKTYKEGGSQITLNCRKVICECGRWMELYKTMSTDRLFKHRASFRFYKAVVWNNYFNVFY